MLLPNDEPAEALSKDMVGALHPSWTVDDDNVIVVKPGQVIAPGNKFNLAAIADSLLDHACPLRIGLERSDLEVSAKQPECGASRAPMKYADPEV